MPLFPTPAAYAAFAYSISAICAVLQVSMGLHHFRKSRKKKYKKSQERGKLSVWASFVLVLSGLGLIIHTFFLTKSVTTPSELITCAMVLDSAAPTMSLFKFMMYAVLVTRIWTVYEDTVQDGYSKILLIAWVVIAALWNIANAIISGLWSVPIVVPEKGTCGYIWTPAYFSSVMVMDVFSTAFTTYLFVKPLYELHKQMTDNMGDNQKHVASVVQIKRIANKQCILSILAVGSTLLTKGFQLLLGNAQIFAALDVTFSTWCIMLMYKWYERMADRCFYYFCCNGCASCKGDIDETAKQMPRHMQQKSVSTVHLTATKSATNATTATASKSDLEVEETATKTEADPLTSAASSMVTPSTLSSGKYLD